MIKYNNRFKTKYITITNIIKIKIITDIRKLKLIITFINSENDFFYINFSEFIIKFSL